MTTAQIVQDALTEAFTRLDALCLLPRESLERRADYPDAWSIAEHLEHVALANHFLLLTATKGCAKALRRAASGGLPPVGESDLDTLAAIADPDAFEWLPPRHMVPSGRQDAGETRLQLRGQQERCVQLLADMPAGEGRLHILHMSVHGLGRIDLYQWLYFLVQHARYHLTLIERLLA